MVKNAARLAVCALGLSASPLLAQMYGNPVYFSPNQGIGLTIAGDYGRGLNDAAFKTNYVGGRATLGLERVAITAGGGWEKASGDFDFPSGASFGADLAVTALKGPEVPVSISLQAGGSYTKEDVEKWWNFPLGAAIAFNVNSPSASVEPWIAPRVHITHFNAIGTFAGSTETHAGGSAGLNVGFPSGVGFHVALDYVYVKGSGGASSSDLSPFTVGAGLHYLIKIPSLTPAGTP